MNYRRLAFIAVALLPLNSQANEYKEVMDRLSLESPEFILHANLENDFSTLGAFLTEAYLAYQSATPEVPPVPVNYEMLFQRLGLTNLKSMTIASERMEEKGFVNHAMFHFDGAPGGVFLFLGETNQPFKIGSTAPADAAMVGEFTLKGAALLDVMRNIAIDMMGPLGEGIIDAQLAQPVTPDGLTAQDLVNRLNTRFLIAIKPDHQVDPSMSPALGLLGGNVAIHMAGLADLLESLAPILQGAGFTQLAEGDSTRWVLSVPSPELPLSIFLEAVPDSNDLLLTLSEGSKDWFLAEGDKIGSSKAFMEAIETFPETGLSIWFDDGTLSSMQVDNLSRELAAEDSLNPIMEAVTEFLNGFVGQQAGISYFEEDAYRVVSIQPTSYKTQFAVAGLVVPLSLAASMPQLINAQVEEDEKESSEDSPSE